MKTKVTSKKITKPASQKPATKPVPKKVVIKKTKMKKIQKPVTKILSKMKKSLETKKKTEQSSQKSSKKVENIFIAASEEQCFWVNDGPILKDLPDLHQALKTISKEQFVYHASGKSNDFALWVEYVLLDKKCAKDLKSAKTQKEAMKKVGDTIKKYK